MSAPELESDIYDAVVLGTGLAESIAAAALAKAGKTVLHLDPNEYYGASQASLTLDELVAWSNLLDSKEERVNDPGPSSGHARTWTSPLTPQLEADRRRYALSLFPAVLPSRGPLIDTLIASDVSKYVSFRMLDSVSIWDDKKPAGSQDSSLPTEEETESSGRGAVNVQDEIHRIRRVPGSKEEVFKDKSISLVEKRRLMKFLLFAAGEFENDDILKGRDDQSLAKFLAESYSLPPHLSTSITYAIAHCSSPLDPTLPALLRTRRYLKSVGRYGSGAFLVGQFGGAGEVAQGFCRACAVFGGTYVLGPSAKPSSIEHCKTGESSVTIKVPCHPRPITAKHLISTPTHLPPSVYSSSHSEDIRVAHCIAILDSLPASLKRPPPEDDESPDEDDTAIAVFPPGQDSESIVRALMMGEGTGSCPPGQFVLYLSQLVGSKSPSDPKQILQPYLHRLSSSPLFESYRFDTATQSSHPSKPSTLPASTVPGIVVLQPYAGSEEMTEGLDWEAEQGKAAYMTIMGEGEGVKDFFEKDEEEGGEEGNDL